MSSETIEFYRDLKEIQKEQKAERNLRNREIIGEWVKTNSTAKCITQKENVILFRFPLWPFADFYPSTNKWRADGKTYHGNANKFFKWLTKG